MKVGDKVQQVGEEKHYENYSAQTITHIKSDSRGLWIKFNSDEAPDVWHAAQYYEVVNESR